MSRYLSLAVALIVFGFTLGVSEFSHAQLIECDKYKRPPDVLPLANLIDRLKSDCECRGCNLICATLRREDLTSVDLTKADLRSANLTRANLSSANLEDADLTNADLTNANLTSADLSDADLSDADLSRANLTSADLSDADLRSADLSRANLTSADLIDADLKKADLTNADLSNAVLIDADLSRADLSRADLTNANLTRADLTKADLRSADLSRADLTSADLTSADLTSANFTNAILDKANFTGANFDESIQINYKRIWRDKSKHRRNNTVYRNTTGFPIEVVVSILTGGDKNKDCILRIYIDNMLVMHDKQANRYPQSCSGTVTVPPGARYKMVATTFQAAPMIIRWFELSVPVTH